MLVHFASTFRLLASTQVPEEIQQAFVEKVVHRYWEPYRLPKQGYRAVYLHQVTPEQNLFGWLYNSGLEWQRGQVSMASGIRLLSH